MGNFIPTEEELCARFDVSRTTLHEAIKELCSLNILEIRRCVGTFVKAPPRIVDDPFGFRFQDPDNAKLNLIYHNSEVKRIWEESHKSISLFSSSTVIIGAFYLLSSVIFYFLYSKKHM